MTKCAQKLRGFFTEGDICQSIILYNPISFVLSMFCLLRVTACIGKKLDIPWIQTNVSLVGFHDFLNRCVVGTHVPSSAMVKTALLSTHQVTIHQNFVLPHSFHSSFCFNHGTNSDFFTWTPLYPPLTFTFWPSSNSHLCSLTVKSWLELVRIEDDRKGDFIHSELRAKLEFSLSKKIDLDLEGALITYEERRWNTYFELPATPSEALYVSLITRHLHSSQKPWCL